jgi:transcriptional regulator with XRE-family HTH domain
MTPLQLRFGSAVRRLRREAGFSQEGFAAKAGINRGYYGSIERGKVNLSLDNIGKVAKALGVTVGQLMTEVDKEH